MFIESVNEKGHIYLIECEGKYYTRYASNAKDKFGRYMEFGSRLVENPAEHCMVEFSEEMALHFQEGEYGKEKLNEISEKGFPNPRFVRFIRANCKVLIPDY